MEKQQHWKQNTQHNTMAKDIKHYTNHTKSLQQLERKKACTCRIHMTVFSGFEKLQCTWQCNKIMPKVYRRMCIIVLLLNSVSYRNRLKKTELAKWVVCHPSPPAGKYDVVFDMQVALIRCIISIMCNNQSCIKIICMLCVMHVTVRDVWRAL